MNHRIGANMAKTNKGLFICFSLICDLEFDHVIANCIQLLGGESRYVPTCFSAIVQL